MEFQAPEMSLSECGFELGDDKLFLDLKTKSKKGNSDLRVLCNFASIASLSLMC